MKIRSIIGFLVVLISHPSLASQMTFDKLETEYGLSLVHDIHRDTNGFLWIANDGVGLMKHDSYNTTRYLHDSNDSNSISNDGIRAIEEDSAKNLWIATRHGLNRYLPFQESFKRYS